MTSVTSMRAMTVKVVMRQKYQLPQQSFIVGSFQRDTEGDSIRSSEFLPKLEKGPDLLADYLEQLFVTMPNLHVLLAGWRRQYIISRLEAARIPYTYFEKPSQENVCELYQTLDLYPITARVEGGPQAFIECGLLNVPVISRPVGIAEQVLTDKAIKEDIADAFPQIPSVEHLKLPGGFEEYRKLIQGL